jgi:hypothetical protein
MYPTQYISDMLWIVSEKKLQEKNDLTSLFPRLFLSIFVTFVGLFVFGFRFHL